MKTKNLLEQEDDDLIVSLSKAEITADREAELQLGCASDRKLLLLLAEPSGCCSVYLQLIGFVANG